MMKRKYITKAVAAALFGAMTLGVAGTSAAVAEAGSRVADVPYTMDVRTSYGDAHEVTQLAWHRKKSKKKGYSQGSMTTAVIAGALIGAIIAKNT